MNGSTVARVIDDSILYGGVDYENIVNTAYDIKIGGIDSKRISFLCDISNATIGAGTHIVYKVRRTSSDSWQTIGDFYVDQNTRSDGKTRIIAYDITRKFNTDISTFLAGRTYPITISNLFSALCQNFGCTATTPSINASYSIPSKPLISNGLSLLKAIAEVCAGYITSNNGQLSVSLFATPSASNLVTFTSSDYKRYEIDDSVDSIDRVVCGNINGDITSSGSSSHGTYRINYNALLFNNTTTSAVQTAVDNIKAQIVNVGVPYPCRATLFDLLTPNGSSHIYAGMQIGIGSSSTRTRIFSIYSNNSGCEIESTGGVNRQDTTITQEEENGIFSSQIVKSANEISTKVSQVDYNGNTIVSKINQTATTVSVQAGKINLNGYTDINGYFSVSNDGKVTMKDCVINIDSAIDDKNYIKMNGVLSGNQYQNTLSSRGFESLLVGDGKKCHFDWSGFTTTNGSNYITGDLTNTKEYNAQALRYEDLGTLHLAKYISNGGSNLGNLYIKPDGMDINTDYGENAVALKYVQDSGTRWGRLILKNNYNYETIVEPTQIITRQYQNGVISHVSTLTPTGIIIDGHNPFQPNLVSPENPFVIDFGRWYTMGDLVFFQIRFHATQTVTARSTITQILPAPRDSCGYVPINFSTGAQNTSLTIYLNKEEVHSGTYLGRLSNIGTVGTTPMIISGCYVKE